MSTTTEEDTFNRLRRAPFMSVLPEFLNSSAGISDASTHQMLRFIVGRVRASQYADPSTRRQYAQWHKQIKEAGWTLEEFEQEVERRYPN